MSYAARWTAYFGVLVSQWDRARSDMFSATALVLGALHAYKMCVSPFLPSACRFYPTCSIYAHQAVSEYGPIRGLWMAALRLMRCHPFHPGGFDPVPERVRASS